MKLSLTPAPTFVSDAFIQVPGQETPVRVAVTWRHKGKAALAAWLDATKDYDDAAALMEIIAGWGDEIDAPFSEESLMVLLDQYPTSAMDFTRAYIKALAGAREKN
jgi:hypothetical protein